MVNWQIVYSKHAQKDAKKLAAAGLELSSSLVYEPPRHG
jgi:hypothetical protein